jgi:hypothetical protein
MAWVMKTVVGDPTAKSVLLALANYTGQDGEDAFPSVARLVRDTELSERCVRDKLDWLEAQGFIRRGDQTMAAAYAKRKDRQTVCYDLVLRGAPPAPRDSTGCTRFHDGVHVVPPRGAPPAPNPSLTINDPSGKERAPAATAPGAQDGVEAQRAALRDLSARMKANPAVPTRRGG